MYVVFRETRLAFHSLFLFIQIKNLCSINHFLSRINHILFAVYMYSSGRKDALRRTAYLPNQTCVVSEKGNENKTKKCSGGGADGGCFQDLENCEIKFAQ